PHQCVILPEVPRIYQTIAVAVAGTGRLRCKFQIEILGDRRIGRDLNIIPDVPRHAPINALEKLKPFAIKEQKSRILALVDLIEFFCLIIGRTIQVVVGRVILPEIPNQLKLTVSTGIVILRQLVNFPCRI
ncbi:MAG: hypothetical protein CFE49_20275, partial [Pseudomonas sp. PGPPP3]